MLIKEATTITATTITLMTIPATESPVEARPSFLARGRFDTALLLATTAQTYIKVA